MAMTTANQFLALSLIVEREQQELEEEDEDDDQHDESAIFGQPHKTKVPHLCPYSLNLSNHFCFVHFYCVNLCFLIFIRSTQIFSKSLVFSGLLGGFAKGECFVGELGEFQNNWVYCSPTRFL